MSSLSGGTRWVGGCIWLCKRLAVVLIGGHLLVQVLPVSVTYLALIAFSIGRLLRNGLIVACWTVPFAWNLIPAGYLEQTIYGVVASTMGLLLTGKLLEPVWGSREFLKFIFINLFTSLCVFVTAIILYYPTAEENYFWLRCALRTEVTGLIEHTTNHHHHCVKGVSRGRITVILLASMSSFCTKETSKYLPTLFLGTFIGWIYLRY